jgi:general secretion pathway protein F
VFGFVFFIVGVVFLLSSKEIQIKLKNLIYRLPYLKNIILKVELSYVLSSLGTMLNGGVEISKAIRLSSRVTNHNGLKTILEETYSELKKGHKISQIWRKYDIIPEDIISLTIVGENSAKLGEIFEKLGRKYMENFKNEVNRLLVFLEPAIIVVLGIFVAFIVVAIMLAVVSVSDIYG